MTSNRDPRKAPTWLVVVVGMLVLGFLALLCAGGLWPIAAGLVILLALLRYIIPGAQLVGLALIFGPLLLLGWLFSRILPERVVRFFADASYPPVMLVPVVLGMYGIAYLVYRDVGALVVATAGVLVIFGGPALAVWTFVKARDAMTWAWRHLKSGPANR
ncbi:MAG: hypothetical protein ACR2IE_01825 [Candidatus Sumerlaeaceae bacterium]